MSIPQDNMSDVINPDGQRSLEECQDLDGQAIQRRLDFFNEEIAVLENRVKFQDTGHIKGALGVMRARKREIERRRHGEIDWFDEYLFGN